MNGERLTAGDICTRVVAIAFGSTAVTEAARVMREQHVGSLVVVDETKSGRVVVGMLTDRDIVTAVVARELDPRTLRVEDIMTTDLVTVRAEDSLSDVLAAMQRKGVRRLPVTMAAGVLVGVVAVDDLVELAAEQLQSIVRAIGRERKREETMRP